MGERCRAQLRSGRAGWEPVRHERVASVEGGRDRCPRLRTRLEDTPGAHGTEPPIGSLPDHSAMSFKLAPVQTSGRLSETSHFRTAGPRSNAPQELQQVPRMLEGRRSCAAHVQVAASAATIHGSGCRGELAVTRNLPVRLLPQMARWASVCDERLKAQRTPSQRAAPFRLPCDASRAIRGITPRGLRGRSGRSATVPLHGGPVAQGRRSVLGA